MQTEKRFYILDCVKFILAIIIVFHHFQQSTVTKYAEGINYFYGNISFGYAVEFFYIISGFLTIYAWSGKDIGFSEFFIRKCKRLYPMIAISVFVTIIMQGIYKIIFHRDFLGITLDIWRIFNSFLLTFAGGAVTRVGLGINNPLWYVCVLLQCYCFFYFISWYCRRLSVPCIYSFIIMVFIGIGVNNYNINVPFFNILSSRGYASFFLGCVLFYIYKYYFSKIVVLLSFIGMVATCIAYISAGGVIKNQWEIFTFIFFPSIFFGVLKIEKFFVSNIWKVLGAISFQMYIWHMPLIIELEILNKIGIVCKYGGVWTKLQMYEFTFVVICFSWVMYEFVEKKINTKF